MSAPQPDDRPRPKVTLTCGPGRTKQSPQEECDVNFIMNKWKRTGKIPDSAINPRKPAYGDFSNPDDYLSACNQVLEAESAFATLPAFLRERFQNQPINYLAFLADPANQAEAEKLGMVDTPPAESTPETPESPETPEGDPDPAG